MASSSGTARRPARATDPWSAHTHKSRAHPSARRDHTDHNKNISAPAYLGDAKVREHERARARRAPDEEHLALQARRAGPDVDEVRRGVADAKVPEPVARDAHAHRLGADVEREHLADDDPRDGPPRRRERRDVDAHERDERLLPRRVRHRDRHADDRDEELAHAHERRAVEQQRAPPEALDAPHARQRHEHVHDVRRDADQERVFDARVGEERRAVCAREKRGQPRAHVVTVRETESVQ